MEGFSKRMKTAYKSEGDEHRVWGYIKGGWVHLCTENKKVKDKLTGFDGS